MDETRKPAERAMSKEEICTHLGDEYDRHLGAIVPPIFQNTLFTRKTTDHGYSYTRAANPTIELAEKKIAALEGAEEARCFSSGMAAITAALMTVMEKDCHIVCPRNVYPPTKAFLDDYMAKFGVDTTFVSGDSADEFERALRPNTKAIYLETPLSNVFALQDLRAVSALARSRGIVTIADNSWATPMYQNPIAHGVDLVVHSASKYLGGHSDIIAGVMVGSRERLEPVTHRERGLFGASMDPHQAWLLIRGLRTLPVRMRQHQESALRIAAFLEAHPLVERVLYPGLPSHPQYELGRSQMSGYSGLLGFVPKGSREAIAGLMKALRLFEEGPSWGGFESLVNSPGLWLDEEASRRSGIPQGLLRVSIGLEHADALIEDLDAALHGMKRG
ncbi:aminotransferase class I/II-fold pyridoxal phosphate-dependent enzyme [Paenibacillus sp. MWE-103]|uniref:Aminotransferase class I/II-fold pyridoxal phosphate-dependent enzyme n=1 Tax=Paenibacillus artemisiicola TaxID=1172618 RepID=A0ABS3WDP2_9BACL|nr:aminotransferase class I/II-fold pyridoxal phosphate-dependent enzyme [Paenibacillus artemisiicola]MBO7746414.1 aminotransferase class I/II-fold pyridoxal phosphate-dependent enzyme [Paenibacillus artemisiicola]